MEGAVIRWNVPDRINDEGNAWIFCYNMGILCQNRMVLSDRFCLLYYLPFGRMEVQEQESTFVICRNVYSSCRYLWNS